MTYVSARTLSTYLKELDHKVTTTLVRRLVCGRLVQGYRGLDWMIDFPSFRQYIDGQAATD